MCLITLNIDAMHHNTLPRSWIDHLASILKRSPWRQPAPPQTSRHSNAISITSDIESKSMLYHYHYISTVISLSDWRVFNRADTWWTTSTLFVSPCVPSIRTSLWMKTKQRYRTHIKALCLENLILILKPIPRYTLNYYCHHYLLNPDLGLNLRTYSQTRKLSTCGE